MSSSLRSDASGLLGALQINGVDSVTFDSAGVNLGVEHPIKSIVASVAANALTVGLAATTLEFRSSTLSIGATTRLAAPSQTMTVPSGATLGTTNAVASRIVLLAINNSGVVELAVTNMAGGLNLDETTLINTTALSSSSDSANVVYSLVARTGVPFRVVGFVDSTQATAGTWATAPTTVQGCGGQAITSMASIGYGQTWQNVIGSRSVGTTYTNTTGKPIHVMVSGHSSGTSSQMLLYVGGVIVSEQYYNLISGSSAIGANVSAIVPHGATYSISASGFPVTYWAELR